MCIIFTTKSTLFQWLRRRWSVYVIWWDERRRDAQDFRPTDFVEFVCDASAWYRVGMITVRVEHMNDDVHTYYTYVTRTVDAYSYEIYEWVSIHRTQVKKYICIYVCVLVYVAYVCLTKYGSEQRCHKQCRTMVMYYVWYLCRASLLSTLSTNMMEEWWKRSPLEGAKGIEGYTCNFVWRNGTFGRRLIVASCAL